MLVSLDFYRNLKPVHPRNGQSFVHFTSCLKVFAMCFPYWLHHIDNDFRNFFIFLSPLWNGMLKHQIILIQLVCFSLIRRLMLRLNISIIGIFVSCSLQTLQVANKSNFLSVRSCRQTLTQKNVAANKKHQTSSNNKRIRFAAIIRRKNPSNYCLISKYVIKSESIC